MIWRSFLALDRTLRGEGTSPEALENGELRLPLRGFCLVATLLAMAYGLCMGSFSVFRDVNPAQVNPNDRYWQVLASMVKVPALYFLTLIVTTPSLYVFNALVGSRLRAGVMIRLLVTAMSVNLAVLASLGPIVAFFSMSTPSYDFMLLFNVVMFAIAGLLGLLFLLQTLNRLSLADGRPISITAMPATPDSTPLPVAGASEPPAETSPSSIDASATDLPSVVAEVVASDTSAGAPSSSKLFGNLHPKPAAIDAIPGQAMGKHVRTVFRCWILLYGLVGAQMGWVLRPFLGNPEMPFTWFRERESNFFEAIIRTVERLVGILP